jgi:hypothetical protein
MTDMTVNAKPGETIHLDVHVDGAAAPAAAEPAAAVSIAAAHDMHTEVMAADGRRGTVASRRVDGAVRLQIGVHLTGWIAAGDRSAGIIAP